MFMPLVGSVLSLKISLISALCLDAVPPFTCLTTVTLRVLAVAVYYISSLLRVCFL